MGGWPAVNRPVSIASRLARAGFADAGKARELLGPDGLGLLDGSGQAPSAERDASGRPPDLDRLLDALARAADPDLALLQLQRAVDAERRAAGRGDAGTGDDRLLDAVFADAAFTDRLVALLGASATLGDYLVANPGEWRVLVEPESAADLGDASDPAALRRAYRRSLMRIVAADLTGGTRLEDTMAALSALADATLQAALDMAVAEKPELARMCRLAVIAMGKCGGRELNYVSDVDVIFVAEPADGRRTRRRRRRRCAPPRRWPAA